MYNDYIKLADSFAFALPLQQDHTKRKPPKVDLRDGCVAVRVRQACAIKACD